MKGNTPFERIAIMSALILGGESIYTLPYFLRRDYSTTMAEALQISQTQLGTLSATFGVLALICYFPGGWLADRLSTRHLLTGSLIGTGFGGLAFATFPGYSGALAIFSFWGISTILTFWSALIKAARLWGGEAAQGRAFGILDGGRAFFGAVFGSMALAVFGQFTTELAGLQAVVLFYSSLNFLCAGLTWVYIPVRDEPEPNAQPDAPAQGFSTLEVLKVRAVWLHAAVIFCAYSAYWGTYNLAGYASGGFGLDATASATISVFGTWFGPPAAIGAGFLADRFGASRTVTSCLIVLSLAMALLAAVPPMAATVWLLWFNAALACAASFALRGTYYSLLKDSGVPSKMTGVAVGFVSVVGYSPDIFIPTLTGVLVDGFPGGPGYRYLFGILAVLSATGALCAWGIGRYARTRSTSLAQ